MVSLADYPSSTFKQPPAGDYFNRYILPTRVNSAKPAPGVNMVYRITPRYEQELRSIFKLFSHLRSRSHTSLYRPLPKS